MMNLLREGRRQISWKLKLSLWLIEGREKHSGAELVVAYAAPGEEPKNYFARLAFADAPNERLLGREWLWRMPARVKRESPGCALLVYEINKNRERLFASHGLLRSPVWVRFELPLRQEDLPPSGRAKLKDMRRKIRQRGFTASVSRQQKDFDDFYHQMYLPSVNRRHGGSAFLQPYEPLRKRFLSSGELTFVHKDGVGVAGGLVEYADPDCTFLCHGMKDGSEEHLRAGAADVLHYFEIMRAREKGVTRVDLGHCRAFFNDGVFRHKVELGARVVDHNPMGGLLHFRFLRRTEGLKNFLCHNPFVALEGDGVYRGAFFVDGPVSVEGLDEKLDQMHCRGVRDVTIYHFEDLKNRQVQTASGRRIRFLAASSLLPGSQ